MQPGPRRGSPRDEARRHTQRDRTGHGEIDLDALAEAQTEVGASMKHRGERREVPYGAPTTRAAELDPLRDWAQQRRDSFHEPRPAIHSLPHETERRLARGAIGRVNRRRSCEQGRQRTRSSEAAILGASPPEAKGKAAEIAALRARVRTRALRKRR